MPHPRLTALALVLTVSAPPVATTIVWPEHSGKTGTPHTVPMNEPTRAAIRCVLAASPRVGAAYDAAGEKPRVICQA